MLGLYIHIPFCARRCPYCDFAIQVGADAAFRASYVEALRRELTTTLGEQVRREPQRAITSIFFGGGTPTELEANQLGWVLSTVRDNIAVAPQAEITIEANPENLSFEKLSALQKAGFNRLSLGAQSFDEVALKALGRVHKPEQTKVVVDSARRAGWRQVSLDLIYAVPGQSRESWQQTLRRAMELNLEHISCYSLTIEDGTPFAHRVASGRLLPMADDAQADFMNDAMAILGAAGLYRYEVSNYALPDGESQHNLNYWRGGDYLAAGCGAHGHMAGHRWWNERAARRYVDYIEATGSARAGEEFLSAPERLSEIVMLGLRLREGIALDEASRRLNLDARSVLQRSMAWPALTAEGILHEDKEVLRLNPSAWPVADAVTVRLLS